MTISANNERITRKESFWFVVKLFNKSVFESSLKEVNNTLWLIDEKIDNCKNNIATCVLDANKTTSDNKNCIVFNEDDEDIFDRSRDWIVWRSFGKRSVWFVRYWITAEVESMVSKKDNNKIAVWLDRS